MFNEGPPACTQVLIRRWHNPLINSRGFDAWSFTLWSSLILE